MPLAGVQKRRRRWAEDRGNEALRPENIRSASTGRGGEGYTSVKIALVSGIDRKQETVKVCST